MMAVVNVRLDRSLKEKAEALGGLSKLARKATEILAATDLTEKKYVPGEDSVRTTVSMPDALVSRIPGKKGEYVAFALEDLVLKATRPEATSTANLGPEVIDPAQIQSPSVEEPAPAESGDDDIAMVIDPEGFSMMPLSMVMSARRLSDRVESEKLWCAPEKVDEEHEKVVRIQAEIERCTTEQEWPRDEYGVWRWLADRKCPDCRGLILVRKDGASWPSKAWCRRCRRVLVDAKRR